MKKIRVLVILVFVILSGLTSLQAQSLLSRTVSIEAHRQRLDNVLEILSNKGNFYFSYNSSIIRKDSLVSISVRNKTVKETLNLLFNQGFEFIETGNYIIIRKTPIRLTMITNKAVLEERIYSVSGYVYDEHSGSAINEASVYEKKLLAAALTNSDGYFKIKLKSTRSSSATLTISKEFYEDTSIVIEPRHSQQLTITMLPFERPENTVIISPEDYLIPDTLEVPEDIRIDTVKIRPSLAKDSAQVERTGMGRFLLSTRQKVQSINLKNFFTSRPFQVSLVPGVSSHGGLGSQVVNNFSLNVLGGYTAGTRGFELGGLFNIDKKDVRYVQLGGLFNAVGGQVQGLQIAGINNTVLDTVSGFQVAGVNNYVHGKFRGFQLAGVYNHVTDSLKGMQVAGVANFTRKKMSGFQLAGVINFSNRETDGVQISGVFNYSKRLRGVQIGLINIADTSEGYSIGLINIILRGYHKLSFYTNEASDINAAFKTGNRRLYSILLAGMNTGSNSKAYSFGYGLGSEIRLNKRQSLTLNPELSSQYVYLGSWDYHNILNRLQVNLNLHLGKWVSVFAGPTLAIHISDQLQQVQGYQAPFPASGYKSFSVGNRTQGWFGWNAGINFF